MHKELTDAGIFPHLVKLDNEASSEMIKTIKKNISFQLAPPRDHWTNPAERSIRTFKDHFIATLFGIYDKYPGNQWCRLIRPGTMTLNMLRGSRTNPKFSSYQQIWGDFEYNTTTLSPPGCLAVIYDASEYRPTWSNHGTIGYYTGPAEDHYRNNRIYIPTTGGTRIGSTVDFFPKHVQMPSTTSEYQLVIVLGI